MSEQDVDKATENDDFPVVIEHTLKVKVYLKRAPFFCSPAREVFLINLGTALEDDVVEKRRDLERIPKESQLNQMVDAALEYVKQKYNLKSVMPLLAEFDKGKLYIRTANSKPFEELSNRK